MKKILIIGLLIGFCIVSIAAVSGSAVNSQDRNIQTSDNVSSSDTGNQDPQVSQIDNSNSNNDVNQNKDENRKDSRHPDPCPTVTKVPHNCSVPVTCDYDAKIAALEKQIREQDKEIKRQGNILDQIVSFLRKGFGWK
jgi:hypothetical protein